MKQQLKVALAECDRRIEQCRTAGDSAGEVEQLSHKAALLMATQDWAAAAAELQQIVPLVSGHGETHIEAQAYLAVGKVLANLPDRRADAENALRQALARYGEARDARRAAEALKSLAALKLEEDPAAAIAMLDQAVAGVQEGGAAPQTLLSLVRFRAECRVLALDFEQGLADIEWALSLATALGDAQTIVAIQAQKLAMTELAGGQTAPDAFDELMQAAQASDNHRVVADVRLKQALLALKEGRSAKGLQLAQAVLADARRATDIQRFVRYLMASLLIAEIEDALNNRTAVLTALLRCKVYLETNLGAFVTPYMDALLDNLSLRWGEDGLRSAIDAYQRQTAATGPIQM